MGLPINKLIIATNSNDILNRVLKTGVYKPSKVKHTVSPSMDIQVASNFERLIFDACLRDSNKTLKFMKDLYERGEFAISKAFSETFSEEEQDLSCDELFEDDTFVDTIFCDKLESIVACSCSIVDLPPSNFADTWDISVSGNP